MQINLVKKLTSRKLWMALAGLVTGLIVALGGTEEAAAQVSGIILSAASVVAYIVGEGLVDAGAAQQKPPDAAE